MVESGSEIVFNQMLFDRSLGAMRKGYFTAPVEGYWRFDMQLSLKMLSTEEFGLKYLYEIEVLHNNKVGNRLETKFDLEFILFVFVQLCGSRTNFKMTIKQLTTFMTIQPGLRHAPSKPSHTHSSCQCEPVTR